MINACGLWKVTSKEGKDYLLGRLGGVKVMVFKNEMKKEDKHPDYNMVFAEYEKKENKKEEKEAF